MRGSLEYTKEDVENYKIAHGVGTNEAVAGVRKQKMREVVQHVRDGGFTHTSNERIDTLCDVLDQLIGES